jgi:putative hydrolase of the HAD superfamily
LIVVIPLFDRSPSGIVFDAVGTLIEPEPSSTIAYRDAARRQGIELDPELVRDRFYRALAADDLNPPHGPLTTDESYERIRWRRIVAHCLPEIPDLDRAFSELWEHFARPSSWCVYDDVEPALRAIKRLGKAIWVGSNFDARLRGVVAGHPVLAETLDSLVISSEIGFRKPHPGFYLNACKLMALEPGDVLFVGDDPAHDVEGPRLAGLRGGILIDRKRRAAEQIPRALNLVELADRIRARIDHN